MPFSDAKKSRFAIVALIICALVDFRLAQQVFSDRTSLLANADATLSQLTKTALLRTESKLDIFDRTLSGLSEVVRFHDGIAQQPDLETHRLLLRRHSITRDLQWLSLIDAQGKLAEYSLAFPAPSLNIADRAYFAVHRDHPDTSLYIGKAQSSRIDQQSFIPISRAVRNDMEVLQAVAAAGVDSAALHTAIFEPPPPAHFQIRLLIDSGFAIACFPAHPDCLSRDEDEAPGFIENPNPPGLAASVDRQADPSTIAIDSAKFPIRVLGHYDKEAIVAPWRSRAQEILVTAILANLALILLGLFAYRQFKRLKQAVEEIKHHNETLETRVQERTEALQQSETRANQILLSSPVAMLLVREDGSIEMANARANQLLGGGNTDLTGYAIEDFIPVPLRGAHSQLRRQFHETLSREPMRSAGREVSALSLDGREIPVEVGLGAQLINGQHYVIATIIDISARKQAEAQRLSLYHRLELAIEAADIGIWSWHFADNRLEWDQRLCAWYELPSEKQTQGFFYDFWRARVHPEDIAQAEMKLAQAQRDGLPLTDEFRIVLDDGRLRYIQSGCITEKDASGQAIGMIGINRDITAQRQLEASLRVAQQQADTANRAKSDFLATMSHEIRTPMNAIIGMTDLVLASKLDHSQRDHLEKAHRASKALLHILNDILDYSKIEAGYMRIEQVPFALRESITAIANLFALQLEEKGLVWHVEIDPALPPLVLGDALRLGQILANLLSNAIKFTEHGEIHLQASLANRSAEQLTVRFTISDTGIGMTPEQTDRLFSAFSQADSTISRRYGGTGLGLSIVKRLVELLGGSIEVSSQPDRGSRFTFSARFLAAENGEVLPSTVAIAQQYIDGGNATDFGDNPEPVASTRRQIDRQQLDPLLSSLATQLANNNLSAKRLIDQIEGQLADSTLAAPFMVVSAATRKLKFREAETALSSFMMKLADAIN